MKRTVLLALLAAVVASIPASTALAHPLGNFTVNRYAGLSVRPDAIAVDYVVDMAEIPAYQEIGQQIDTDHDGVTDEKENQAYRDKQCAALPERLSLAVNGQMLPLQVAASTLEFPPGAGGLLTLRLTCTFRADLSNAAAQPAGIFRDGNFADRIGWREIVVQGDGTRIFDSNAPAASVSHRLRSYPTDLLSSPPQQTEARFSFAVASAVPPQGAANTGTVSFRTAAGTLDRTKDSFAALITVSDLSPAVILLSLLVAIGLGALHAVSPGHGKTIMAAYLVGTRGTIGQALLLGLTVTVTHTLGVLALGLLTLFASRYILPDNLYPWLSLLSGVIVVGMGVSLAWNRWRGMHHHAHSHSFAHSHELHHEHHHHHRGEEEETSAELAHAHSHLPKNFQEEGLKWKDLVALGLVGGLVPSASALIVLLAAISLQRIAFGIVLVIAFGLGMAFVLVGTGVLLVRAGRLLERRRIAVGTLAWMPLASALVVIGAGLFVTAQATLQMGLWKP